ncbi:hypothetical protein [Rhizobium leguminosarum]|uniref:hypothetical protein n=1 Tax=Rhizobium leguminosarum TaxID=384 RepID=UPI001F2C2B08|nr:hypothetical protein [Rhizobium leguminosarum]UIK19373.1 hypothetical protein LZK79_10300 [Rhizobium leguminosarum]
MFLTDLSNTLRDVFIDNDGQTPYFVYQGTGRETLVDDATKLDEFRMRFADLLRSSTVEIDESADVAADEGHDSLVADETPTSLQLLRAAEEKIGSPKQTKDLIGGLFDGLKARISGTDFTELFDINSTERAQYDEPTIEEFMIRVLSREKRPDRLVTAEVKRKKRKPTPLEAMSAGIFAALNQDYIEHFDLHLNCSLERAQLTIALTPKYRTLQRLVLVVSCAPSLEHCYVFEMVTKHPRTDWDAYDTEGEEVVRRWYTLVWDKDSSWLVEKVCEGLMTAVNGHVEDVTKRLSER